MRKSNTFIMFFIFIVYGWLEFKALIFIGDVVGGLVTFLGLFFTAFTGIFLIKLFTRSVFMAWRKGTQDNEISLSKLAEGLSILCGGLLLIIPGYITDLIGLIFMIPILRVSIGSIIIANFSDLKLFTELRKKHRNDTTQHRNSEFDTRKIVIDGEYKEK